MRVVHLIKNNTMKKLLTIGMLLISMASYSQYSTIDAFISDTNLQYKAGSCGSPDGPTTLITAPPPDYQYLEDNGYCLYNYPTTSAMTACFTVVSPGTALDFNAGFSHTCNNISFGGFTLYDAGCSVVGTGLSFTGLTSGATYTWCLNMRAFGGPGCNGFDNFCPYYIDQTPLVLPIELAYFTGKCGELEWRTESESNNDYFMLYFSPDFSTWLLMDTVDGAGTSITPNIYRYLMAEISGYYMLVPVDYNGDVDPYIPVYVQCKELRRTIVKYLNLLGQEINYNDIKQGDYYIIMYSDGNTSYTFKKE